MVWFNEPKKNDIPEILFRKRQEQTHFPNELIVPKLSEL